MTEVGKRIATYKGRRVDTLTREELIEAYTIACTELHRMRMQMIDDIKMNRYLDRARRTLYR